MAPEMLDKVQSPKADVSFGVVLWELLARKLPFSTLGHLIIKDG